MGLSRIFLCHSPISPYHRPMNTFLIILAIVSVALILWIAGTLFVIRGIEEPTYTVVEKRDGYEIRDYASYIVAEVEVEGEMWKAINEGFRQLAAYIFGGNTSKTQVKMTTPVMDTAKTSENIKMTTPVMDSMSNSGKHIVAFTMPSKYTLETLPKPDNANIRLRVVEKSRRAVLRYSWYATTARVETKKQLLTESLARDGYTLK